MSFFHSLRVSASGLSAQRLRMDTISNNLANANSTRTEHGGAYKRQRVVFAPIYANKRFEFANMARFHNGALLPQNIRENGGGVKVMAINEDQTEGKMVYDPSHPDAGVDGYVEMPNVNTVVEMTDMIAASRSYEANVAAIKTTKAMALKALELGRA